MRLPALGISGNPPTKSLRWSRSVLTLTYMHLALDLESPQLTLATSDRVESLSMDLAARLRNWAHWLRSRPASATCASAEHLYRSPQCWYPPAPRHEPDIADALLVESAVTRLPAAEREMLKSVYVYRSRPEVVRRRMKLEADEYTELLAMAHALLQSVLDGITLRSPLPARDRSLGTAYA